MDTHPLAPLFLGTRKAPGRGKERSTSIGRQRWWGSASALGVPLCPLRLAREQSEREGPGGSAAPARSSASFSREYPGDFEGWGRREDEHQP